jgi:ribosomal protein S12 methylthiotransferase
MLMPLNRHIPRIGFISLGCAKATVDSERILTRLRAEGYDFVGQYEQADLVVINTCGFIDAAIEESLQVIGEALQRHGRVIVTGCLGVRADIIHNAYPQVLAISGTEQDYEAVIEAVHAHLPPLEHPFETLLPPQGIKLTPRHYAYLKIAEGCNHQCRFCIIPSLRGPLVSRPLYEILDEAEQLVAAGARELLIIAQDTGAYGHDQHYRLDFWRNRPLKMNLETLARMLGELPVWIRLHYLYPYPHLDRIIELMADNIIVPYLDLPLQHVTPRLLKAMRRPGTADRFLRRLEHWRTQCPTLAIRSTFIVGFPGETDADFAELLAFLEAAQLDRVGCFTYSPVEGAAANQLPDPVPEPIKQDRFERFMATQAAISQAKLAARVGERVTVLVDDVDDDRCLARSYADTPEVDGVVIVPGAWDVTPGDFIDVEIIDHSEYDLIAKPVLDQVENHH